MDKYCFSVEPDCAGLRIDKYLSGRLDVLSRNALAQLIADENITVNGAACGKNYKLKSGDKISVLVPPPRRCEVLPENIPLDVVYEDSYLLVVNKPKGMVVHPAAGNYEGTLVNALLYHCGDSLSGINGVMRPGIVHRIDKDTSGLLIVAKTDAAHNGLALQIKEHSFGRQYEAVAAGHFKNSVGIVDAPIGRHPVDRKKMTVTPKNSKNAVTHYRVLQEYKGYSHIACRLETGRTHQIRVHMAYLGHPLAGDVTYGGTKAPHNLFEGQCLHARMIGFVHPISGKYMEFESELPYYFKQFLEILSNA